MFQMKVVDLNGIYILYHLPIFVSCTAYEKICGVRYELH
jgi:hypothetical protein